MLDEDLVLANGLRLPQVVFGCSHRHLDDGVREELYLEAIQRGFRGFDAADIYGAHLPLGRAIRRSGRRPFVITKVPPARMTPEGIRLACEQYRDELGYLDLLLWHAPLAHPEKVADFSVADCWRAMEELEAVGGIGVSNAGVGALDRILAVSRQPPLVDQIELHPCLAQADVVARCRHHGIAVQAYSPLRVPLHSPLVHELARRHGVSPVQLILSWHARQQIAVVVSATRVEHMEDFRQPRCDGFDLAELQPLDVGLRHGMWGSCLAGMYHHFAPLPPRADPGDDLLATWAEDGMLTVEAAGIDEGAPRLLGERTPQAFTAFARGRLLDLVCRYRRAPMQLARLELEHTRPRIERPPPWRAADEIVAYLHLGEIDLQNGPIFYLRGTHREPVAACEGRDDAEVFAAINPFRLLTAAGGAGQLVLVDGNGLHRDGQVFARERMRMAFHYRAG